MSEIRTRLQGGTPFFPNMLNNGSVEVCLKEDVDKVIAEKDKEIAELKQKLENVNELIKTARQMLEDAKATYYAESVDAGMRERRLRRALYKACAEWALSTLAWLDCTDQGNPVKWGEMRRKCLEKVEEYK